MFRKKKSGYVSHVDKLIIDFDKNNPKTPSQLAEIKKYERVYKLRDHATPEPDSKIWEGF